MAQHQAPCIHPVSLPSIHEMFPAHLMRPEDGYNNRHKHGQAGRCSHSPRVSPQSQPYLHHTEKVGRDLRLLDLDAQPHVDPRKRSSSHIYSFDVLRSDPKNSSLQHLASSGSLTANSQQHLSPNPVASTSSPFRVSVPPPTASNGIANNPVSIEGRSRLHRTAPDPAIPAMISFPVSRPTSGSSKPNQSPSDDISDDDNPGESAGKKHICPTCLKRFNRPSSLRIHVNTHTGATPFRCPWPNCGREFNVNSNMRRHYRNHTTPGFSRAQPNDKHRKRRRVDALDALNHPMPAVDQAYRRPHPLNLIPSPPISHFSPSDDSEYDSDIEAESYSIQERDELVDYCTKPPAYRSTAGSSFHSSSPSNPPSPRLLPVSTPHTGYNVLHTKREHKYSPSAPYVHSLADTRVSTALRPAFHS